MEHFASNTQVHGHSLKRIVWSALICLFLFPIQAQELSTESRKAQKLYEKADKAYKDRDFYSAISYLEESVLEDPEFFEAFIRMGSLYQAIGNEDSVYSKFQRYVNTSPSPIISVLEKLSFLAFDRGEYDKAEIFLDQFLNRVPERSSSYEIDLLRKSLQFSKEQLTKPTDSLLIEYLPKEVNQFKLQYLPSVTIDNASIFYTKRDHVSGDEDIVVSQKKNGVWQPAQSVSSRINSPLNEGACAVSADGRTMIFTSCDNRNSVGSCDLFITKKVGDSWSYPKNLGKPVNSIYWESQPSLSADGKTLYFSSNRRGGYGGRDIWVSKNRNGKWSEPLNLGKQINSRKDETTPFIHPNGKDLYFSANGLPGMGGYDLYVSSRLDSVWSAPENLGYPINTFKDEVSIVINAAGEMAYFAKEEQKNFEILDSKIVSIQLPERLKPSPVSYMVGKIREAQSGKHLKANIQVVSLADSKVLYDSYSDSLSGEYYMTLPAGIELAAYIKKKGYLYSDFTFATEINSVLEPDTLNIDLDPITEGRKIILKNIYFDVDSYEISSKSSSELQNAFQLLNENPGIRVEISGHTDDSGTNAYNMELSQKRAKAVFDKLVGMGISKDRLLYRGYGDSKPLNPNTTDILKKSNRRIEFRVLRTNQ